MFSRKLKIPVFQRAKALRSAFVLWDVKVERGDVCCSSDAVLRERGSLKGIEMIWPKCLAYEGITGTRGLR